MGYLNVALTISLLMLVSGKPMVEDPSGPRGLSPIETLTNPKLHVYKPLKGDGYEVTEKTPERINILEGREYRGEHNIPIRNYLDFLETWSRKSSKSERRAITVMKLLIVHSWIFSSLEPELSLLRGATPITVDDKTTLDSVRESIVLELGLRNAQTPVADFILLYTTGMYQAITRELQANIRACQTIIVNSNAVYKINEERLQAKVIKVNEDHNALLTKNRILHRYHIVTLWMILQSYIKLFDKQILTGKKTILLESSDGLKKREFSIPPLKSDQFEQLMVEAELEGELDPEDMLDDQPYTADDYRREQNIVIRNYLESFEKIRKDAPSHEESTALTTVKLLVVQSWIHMLRPDVTLMEDIVPLDGAKTPEEVKERIELQLKKTMTLDEVSDALIFYEKSLMSSIRDQLEIQGQELVTRIDTSMDIITGLPEGPRKAWEVEIRDDYLQTLEDLRLAMECHDMTLRMGVQSYALDFLSEPYPVTITLISQRGQVAVPLPPLDSESFEEIAYSGTQ